MATRSSTPFSVPTPVGWCALELLDELHAVLNAYLVEVRQPRFSSRRLCSRSPKPAEQHKWIKRSVGTYSESI